MFRLFYLFAFILLSNCLSGQQIEIVAKINGLNYDTIWFGNTYGKKSFPTFYTLRSEDGNFNIKTDENLSPGIYTIIFKRTIESKYSQIPVIISDTEKKFGFVCDEKDVYGTILFDKSPQSALYYAYRIKYAALNDAYSDAVDEWRLNKSETNTALVLETEQKIVDYQQTFLQNNKNSTIAEVIGLNALKMTGFKGDVSDQMTSREAYLENDFLYAYDFSNASFWKTPLSIDLLDYYTFKSYDDNPATALSRAQAVLNRLSTYPTGFQYYFNYMCNSFSKMSKHDYDQVFVYLYKQYIENGKANWLTPDEVLKYRKDAENIERLMVGKNAPDLQLYKRDNTPVKLSEIKAKINLLVFWSPDCSHCKKELPIIKKLYETYQDKGLTVTTICAKKTEFLPNCFEFEDKTQFPDSWHLLYDGSFKSRMAYLYDLSSFPRIYILDGEQKILFRRRGEVPENELKAAFDKLLQL